MSHNHMSMGSGALPDLTEFPKFYWALVGSAVGIASLVNLYNHVLCHQRLSAARRGAQTPAKPKSWFTVANASMYALTREASSFSFQIPFKDRVLRLPTIGRVSLVLANAIALVVLCLYGLELNGRPITKEAVGYRCGVITVSQLPLIFLLSGKNNLIGYLSGISYERLNWLHRWCARCMLLTATLHMGYFFSSWAAYDYIGVQLTTNKIVWKGLASWCTLLWIVFSSVAPIRGWNYELFVLQHLASFALLITFVYLHVPSSAGMTTYIWLPIGFFFFDRTVRALRALYANVSFFHPAQKRQGQMNSLWACRAEFTPLPHDTTRVVIKSPPISWTPGQHVFLSCHSIAPLQSHPFTIASLPSDGRMEFLIKAQKGGTKRIFRHAEKSHGNSDTSKRIKTVAIEGPYGCVRPLHQFDSVVLLAGSTGATFTMPLLRDIFQHWAEIKDMMLRNNDRHLFRNPPGAATRHIRFVWVVKSKGQLGWFSEQLSAVCEEFSTLQDRLRDIKLEITIYVTCDESFTEEHKSLLSSMTGPNLDTVPKTKAQHGPVQYRGPQIAEDIGKKEKSEIRELAKIESNQSGEIQAGCGTNGTCCCRTSVDESASPDTIQQCTCCSSPSQNETTVKTTNRPTSQTSTSPPASVQQKLFVHPSITIYAGRPQTREIIRRSLEQAMGESAVVVCGPHGLVADVKQDVCYLSDERAVHKGTGAQGIYLHTESFGY